MKNLIRIYLFPISLIALEIAIFLSNDMYLPSMPRIAQDLGLTQRQVQFTLTFWFLGSSSLQLFLGPISDRYGRKVVILTGGIVYILSSFVCAIAQSLSLLLLARFIQGTTICAITVAGGASIHESFNTKMAIKIFSFINAVTILAPAFGPLFGALVVEFAGWRDIFFILTGLGIFATTLAILFIPETNKTRHSIHVKRIFGDYKSLLFNKEFMLPNISYCLLFSIFFLWMFEAPFLMIEYYGVSNLYYGVSQVLIFACFFIGAQLNKHILNKHNLKILLNIAIVITIIGTVGFALLAKFTQFMGGIIFCMMVISTGTSMLFAPLGRISIEASTAPMGCRLAIASTSISLFGAFTGWLVSLISVHSFVSIAILIVTCVAIAIVFLLKTKLPVLFVT